MRICFVYGGKDKTDGGVGFLRNLASSLQEEGHTCIAIVGDRSDPLLDGAVNQEFHVKGTWSLGFGAAERDGIRQMWNAFKQAEPDIVHVIHPCGGFGVQGHIHALPVIWRRASLVTTFWGLNVGPKATWRARVVVPLLLWGSREVAAHDFGLMKYLKYFSLGLRQIHFLPVGSNISLETWALDQNRDELRRRFGWAPGVYYLAYFGGFDAGRGLDSLFQCVSILSQRGLRVKLLLVGWQRHLTNPLFTPVLAAIKRYGISEKVQLTPYAPADEVAVLLRAADICVFPFLRNPVGRSSVIGALSVGAAIVLASTISDLGPIDHAVKQVPPGSPWRLAATIESLLKDPEECEILRKRARQVWLDNFTWSKIAAMHLRVYQQVVGQ